MEIANNSILNTHFCNHIGTQKLPTWSTKRSLSELKMPAWKLGKSGVSPATIPFLVCPCQHTYYQPRLPFPKYLNLQIFFVLIHFFRIPTHKIEINWHKLAGFFLWHLIFIMYLTLLFVQPLCITAMAWGVLPFYKLNVHHLNDV